MSVYLFYAVYHIFKYKYCYHFKTAENKHALNLFIHTTRIPQTSILSKTFVSDFKMHFSKVFFLFHGMETLERKEWHPHNKETPKENGECSKMQICPPKTRIPNQREKKDFACGSPRANHHTNKRHFSFSRKTSKRKKNRKRSWRYYFLDKYTYWRRTQNIQLISNRVPAIRLPYKSRQWKRKRRQFK